MPAGLTALPMALIVKMSLWALTDNPGPQFLKDTVYPDSGRHAFFLHNYRTVRSETLPWSGLKLHCVLPKGKRYDSCISRTD